LVFTNMCPTTCVVRYTTMRRIDSRIRKRLGKWCMEKGRERLFQVTSIDTSLWCDQSGRQSWNIHSSTRHMWLNWWSLSCSRYEWKAHHLQASINLQNTNAQCRMNRGSDHVMTPVTDKQNVFQNIAVKGRTSKSEDVNLATARQHFIFH
jgi:hypothetical protein